MGTPLTLVTHDHCLDGATCGVLGLAAGMLPAFVYPDGAQAFLSNLPLDRPVVLADVSFPPEVYPREAERLVALIDHHQSALPLADRPRVHIDQRHCASTLLYEWLTATGRLATDDARWRPLLDPVDDYDLWRPEHKAGQALSRLYMARGWAWFRDKFRDGWSPLTEGELQQLQQLESEEAAFVDHYSGRAELFDAASHRLAVVWLEEEGAVNELSHRLLTQHTLAGVIAIKPDGRLSCRTSPALDAARLMEAGFQGGGHPRAAGGRLPAGTQPAAGVAWVKERAAKALAPDAADVMRAAPPPGGREGVPHPSR